MGRCLEVFGFIFCAGGLQGCLSIAVGVDGGFQIGTVFVGVLPGPIRQVVGSVFERLLRNLVIGCCIGLGAQRLFLGQQRFAVGDRDAVVVGVDFTERQEAVAITPVVYEGSLERGFDLGDLREVNVAFKLRLSGGFVVEFFDLAIGNHHHPRLVRVGGIDQHTLCHVFSTPEHARRPGAGLRQNRRRRGRRATRQFLRRNLRHRLWSVGEGGSEHEIAATRGRQREALRFGYEASASPSPRAPILSLLVPPCRNRTATAAEIGRQSRRPPGSIKSEPARQRTRQARPNRADPLATTPAPISISRAPTDVDEFLMQRDWSNNLLISAAIDPSAPTNGSSPLDRLRESHHRDSARRKQRLSSRCLA